MPKWGIGEWNAGNAENKGAKKGMGMRVRKISVGMRGIWVEMWGIREAMQGMKVQT